MMNLDIWRLLDTKMLLDMKMLHLVLTVVIVEFDFMVNVSDEWRTYCEWLRGLGESRVCHKLSVPLVQIFHLQCNWPFKHIFFGRKNKFFLFLKWVHFLFFRASLSDDDIFCKINYIYIYYIVLSSRCLKIKESRMK